MIFYKLSILILPILTNGKVRKTKKTTLIKTSPPPLLPGVREGTVVLASDANYPPYAMLGAAQDDFPLTGFGPDFALGLNDVCEIDIVITETKWRDCWTDSVDGPMTGAGLRRGEFHGCMTYTHSAGVRNRYVDFSNPILTKNKAAGIIVPLVDGVPTVDGNSDLSGLTVMDVAGWAPTGDNLAIVKNSCTGSTFTGYMTVIPATQTVEDNDDALKALLNGEADALWIYADQAEFLKCENAPEGASWDCTLWDGLGTTFAYIHTGIFDWMYGGTTLSISKKGSGLNEILNPCIEAYLETESYFELCQKYGLLYSCFPNEFFPPGSTPPTAIYNTPTNELTTDCSSGYCKCPT